MYLKVVPLLDPKLDYKYGYGELAKLPKNMAVQACFSRGLRFR